VVVFEVSLANAGVVKVADLFVGHQAVVGVVVHKAEFAAGN